MQCYIGISYAKGPGFHKHTISNFIQTGVLHEATNSTTINGTMTISYEDGIVQILSEFLNLEMTKYRPCNLTDIKDPLGPRLIAGKILPWPDRTINESR